MADYPIALDPALGIDPQALCAAWEADAAARGTGTLTTAGATTRSFHDPTAVLYLATAVGIASGVLTSILSHILIAQVGAKKQFEVQVKPGPDGREIIVIKET